MTDNLQSLPDECRERAQELKPETPDNLNFVPSQSEPKGVGSEFRQEVREVERELQQNKLQVESMVMRAEQLAAQYRQAEQEKRNATRSWSYRSREIIQKADESIQKAREGKQQLLNELNRQRMPREDKQKIDLLLQQIADQ